VHVLLVVDDEDWRSSVAETGAGTVAAGFLCGEGWWPAPELMVKEL